MTHLWYVRVSGDFTDPDNLHNSRLPVQEQGQAQLDHLLWTECNTDCVYNMTMIAINTSALGVLLNRF